jgi:hypothetical protein
MDSETIERIIWSTQIGRKQFLGCFPSDKIPKPSKYPMALIINEDPSIGNGTHWVAAYIKNKDTIYYFDSYGKKPITVIQYYLQNFKNIEKNKIRFQSLLSQNCGYYCIYFVIFSCLNVAFKNIIHTLTNVSNPDMFVLYFVKKHFLSQ